MDKSKYIDENGYPGTRQWDDSFDGGDTAAIMGNVKALTPLAAEMSLPMDYPHIWIDNNFYPIRHPDKTTPHSDYKNFSRDQLIPILCSFLGRETGRLRLQREHFYEAHKKRYFIRSWNADVCGPEIWALWLRICNPRWKRAFLGLLDIETLVNSLIWRLYRKDRVTRNHMLVTLMIQEHSPTWVGKLAFKILDWGDMLQRWQDHCIAVGEYPTWDLFRQTYERLK